MRHLQVSVAPGESFDSGDSRSRATVLYAAPTTGAMGRGGGSGKKAAVATSIRGMDEVCALCDSELNWELKASQGLPRRRTYREATSCTNHACKYHDPTQLALGWTKPRQEI